ncbi:putative benzoate 4-monooxygenase cytochrome p450 [Diplodia seriata]|uniref:Putative benzoate 4-monooxygenase cytochrome p450 n=1 Tax=Diplodia seriata TaxID=420778 RepID=A0A0G2G4I9_9PEZI|nr:putative benzoate 4-monooxygenase cytochrome p450 [Diplodia seriata]
MLLSPLPLLLLALTLPLVIILKPLLHHLFHTHLPLRRFPSATPCSWLIPSSFYHFFLAPHLPSTAGAADSHSSSSPAFRTRLLHAAHYPATTTTTTTNDNTTQRQPIPVPVLRTGPTTLSFASPAAIPAIYGHASSRSFCAKGPLYTALGGAPQQNAHQHTNVLHVVDRASHATKRRRLAHGFSLRQAEGDAWQGKIEAEVGVMLDAGSDTTAIALANIMFFLLKNPATFSKLREELDNALPADTIIPSYASVKQLPYLRACLDESLRLIPPVSMGLSRITPSEVGVPAYTAHRDPSLFPDPEEYRPERWLGDKTSEMQAAFIPFSAGSRGCIGRNITYLEQTVLIATLVRRYDFELPSPDWELEREEAFNVWPGSMPLKIKLRPEWEKDQSILAESLER